MEFKDGTNVYTMDGKKAGSLARVVINPETNEVTHIVVEKGFLFKEDKVISAAKVESASQEKIALNCSYDELKAMPPLEFTEYQLNEDGSPSNYAPVGGSIFNYPPPDPSRVPQIKRSISDELVALKEGAQVISADDDNVGDVEHIFTDPKTGNVTHFIITQGYLTKTRKSIPMDWVRLITDDEVFLRAGTQQLEELTEVQS